MLEPAHWLTALGLIETLACKVVWSGGVAAELGECKAVPRIGR